MEDLIKFIQYFIAAAVFKQPVSCKVCSHNEISQTRKGEKSEEELHEKGSARNKQLLLIIERAIICGPYKMNSLLVSGT